MSNNVTLPAQGAGDATPKVATVQQGDGSHIQVVTARELLGPTRRGLRGVLFRERFTHPQLGMYNDGAGSAHRDCEIMLGDLPSCRLDPQGVTSGGTDPGNSPITTGVVFKRRIVQVATIPGATGKYGWEGWIKWTSQNNTTNVFTTVSNYNRDGTNQNGFRIWMDTITTANHLLLKVYDQAVPGWVQFADYNLPAANHSYDPINSPAIPDTAGMWNYFRLLTDFDTGKYVSFQFNELVVDLSTYSMITIASSGARALHFSVEFAQKTATRRFINIADLIGTQES